MASPPAEPEAPADALWVFCVAFAVLGYKLMFWTQRQISVGAVLLCVLCAFAVAQLATGSASRAGVQALAGLAEPVVGAGHAYVCASGLPHVPAAVRRALCGQSGGGQASDEL